MINLEKLLAVFAGVAATGLCAAPALAQAVSPAPFTQAQSDAGRKIYADSCASCHGAGLAGGAVPALVGKDFAGGPYGRRSVAQLYKYIQTSMPFCQGGSLATDAYVNIVAFILQANGAKPGNEPLTPTTDVKVADIITGEMPPGFLKSAKTK